jgi:hypothetical protein
MGSLPFVDKVPVSRGGRVNGSGFEYSSGDSDTEGTVDDVGVTRDPSDVGHASEFVGLGVDIENVLHGEETTE